MQYFNLKLKPLPSTKITCLLWLCLEFQYFKVTFAISSKSDNSVEPPPALYIPYSLRNTKSMSVLVRLDKTLYCLWIASNHFLSYFVVCNTARIECYYILMLRLHLICKSRALRVCRHTAKASALVICYGLLNLPPEKKCMQFSQKFFWVRS